MGIKWTSILDWTDRSGGNGKGAGGKRGEEDGFAVERHGGSHDDNDDGGRGDSG